MTFLLCAWALAGLATLGYLTIARALARRRRPRATRVSLPRPSARPSPSAIASSHPSSPPAHIALRSAQGERPTAFSSTLVVKESHAILGEGHWQHHEAVQSRFGQVMCMFFAGSVQIVCACKILFSVWSSNRAKRPRRGAHWGGMGAWGAFPSVPGAPGARGTAYCPRQFLPELASYGRGA